MVVARARALLRRTELSSQDCKVLRAADLEIDLQAHRLEQAGRRSN